MSNYLKVAMRETIIALLALGWSFRRVERETGIRRETISRYAEELRSKPATPPTGSEQNRPECPPAQPSLCVAFRAEIESKLQQGLDARRIHQDLQHEHGFQGAYDTVKRFCRKLRNTQPEVFARVEVAPGSQMQVDFVRGAPTLDQSTGKYRKPHLFHAVLCYSRHSYEEVVWRQDLATFIRCFENAFLAFGGCTEVVTIDNLKAGVNKASFYDPEINTVFAAFARHYGFAVLPTRPRTPRQNGKVERSHRYAESSALRGRRFETLEEQNLHLQWWNRNVARLRIHGTTKQQVWARFIDQEKASLRSLPHERFSFFRSSTRKVSPDGHIELERAFYSVPHRYLGLELRVDWDDRVVRIYHGHEQVAFHSRTQPGTFQTEPGHLPVEKRYVHHRLESDLLARAERVGPDASAWAQAALQARGVLAYRLLQGMLSLTRKHSAQTVNRACRIALDHQAFRYRTLLTLCKRQAPEQKPLFIQEHELIRPLSEYMELIEKGISDALP